MLRGVFERYDHRLGCLAIRHNERWWVAYPNGFGEPVDSEYEARTLAQTNNLTATEEEREEWKQ